MNEFIEREELASAAAKLLQLGNLPQAEIACRAGIQQFGEDAWEFENLLGMISAKVGAFDVATDYFIRALATHPDLTSAHQHLAWLRSEAPAIAAKLRPPSGESYLLIKSWGYGFWSDVSYVLGQLLLAEITHRTPVIHWGANSKFGGTATSDAFGQYFRPVSNITIDQLTALDEPFFPSKWNRVNLATEPLNQWSGPMSRMAGLYFLRRPERVAVADFFTGVLDLLPWAPPSHPLHGRSIDEAYFYLVDKYLHLRPELAQEVGAFFAAHLAGHPTFAVHVRGTDKTSELPDLHAVNRAYPELIDAEIRRIPDLRVLLLTDDESIAQSYRSRFGDRLVLTECTRATGSRGVHYLPTITDRARLGREIVIDAYLAARCDAFLGNGASNVSAMIRHLKRWPDGAVRLLCGNILQHRNTFLHRR
jgi:hypothetical protein